MPSAKREDLSLNTIIGPHSHIIGNVEAGGFTRVDGSLKGDLAAQGRVIVGERARIKGSLTGTAVTVGGVVYGNILASERVIVLATGIVLGDIITRRIQADEGCLIQGRILVCGDTEKWDTAVREYGDARAVKQVLGGFAWNGGAGTPEAPATPVETDASTPAETDASTPAETDASTPVGADHGES
jgi:cytoskeletal protein CcmA (bactofilin family)